MQDAHWIGNGNVLHLPRLDLGHPTDPKNYVDREFARGTPLNWQDEVTGRLRTSFLAYLSGNPAPHQLQLVIAYLQYHIHAPCWLETMPLEDGKEPDPEIKTEILALRTLSLALQTVDDVRQYLHHAMEIGLDPL